MHKLRNLEANKRIADSLFADISTLIDHSRVRVALIVNQEITLLQNKCADYGEAIVATFFLDGLYKIKSASCGRR